MLGEVSFTHLLLLFFFNDTATTEIYTLSLHDALPISNPPLRSAPHPANRSDPLSTPRSSLAQEKEGDRKSTRLNSSHSQISYAVFCLKKKKKKTATRCTAPTANSSPYHDGVTQP